MSKVASSEPTATFLVPFSAVVWVWVALELVGAASAGEPLSLGDLLGIVFAITSLVVAWRRIYSAAWIALAGTCVSVLWDLTSLWVWLLPLFFAGIVAAFKERLPSHIYLGCVLFVGLLFSRADYGLSEHLVVYGGTIVIPAVCAHWIGRACRRWRISQQELGSSLQISEEARKAALRRQRRALAGHLHDVVAHDLTVINMQAQAVEGLGGDSSTASAIKAIRATSENALLDLRRLLGVLSSEGLVQLDGAEVQPDDLMDELKQCAEKLRGLGFTTHVRCPARIEKIPSEAQRALSYVLKECITNVIKYAETFSSVAGDSQPECTVEIEETYDATSLMVENRASEKQQGPRGKSMGLTSMSDRITSQGGNFEAGMTASGVWTVRASLPKLV